MAYERDPDHMTRGVGAIAAADHVSPDRHRRRIAVGQATRRRDRAMAAVAMGALGTVGARSSNAIVREPVRTARTPGGAPPPPPRPPTPSGPVQTTFPAVPPSVPLPPSMWPTTPPAATQGTPVQSPPHPIDPLPLPPVVPLPPVAVPAPVTGPRTVGTGPALVTKTAPVATVGGGGALSPLPAIPDIDGGDTDNTVRNVAIGAGVAVAAYLLFRRRKGGRS